MEEEISKEVSKSEPHVRAKAGNDKGDSLAFYSGPLPDPEDFRAYESIVPGAGKTILNAFTEQGKHRQKMEKKTVNSQLGIQVLAMILSWSVTLAILGIALYLLANSKEIAGFITLAAVILGKIYTTTRESSKNNNRKQS